MSEKQTAVVSAPLISAEQAPSPQACETKS